MNKKIFGVLIACVSVLALTSCGGKNGKAAYILDAEEYDKLTKEYNLSDYYEGMAVITKTNNSDYTTYYGYANAKGEDVIKPTYLDAKRFSDGLAAVQEKVKSGDKEEYLWGYIDKKGKKVIECKYKSAGEFSDGVAVVVEGENTLFIDNDGETIHTVAKVYTVDAKAKFYKGLVPASKEIDSKTLYGYLDEDGEEVIPFRYRNATNFDELLAGYAVVELGGENYLINTKGEIVISADVEDEIKEANKMYR